MIQSIRIRAGNWIVTIDEVNGKGAVYQACLSRILWDIPTAMRFGWSKEQSLAFGLKGTDETNAEIRGFFPRYELGIGHGSSFILALKALQVVAKDNNWTEKDTALAVLSDFVDLLCECCLIEEPMCR